MTDSEPTTQLIQQTARQIRKFDWAFYGLDEVADAAPEYAYNLTLQIIGPIWRAARAQLVTQITGVLPGDPPPTGGQIDSPVALAVGILPLLATDLRQSATIMDTHWGGEEYRQFANAIDRFLAYWGRTMDTCPPSPTAAPGASGNTPETSSDSSPTNAPDGSAG